jgi:hypothetical protein
LDKNLFESDYSISALLFQGVAILTTGLFASFVGLLPLAISRLSPSDKNSNSKLI